MKVEQRDASTEVLCEVLEKLAFMFGEPVEDGQEAELQTPAEAYLGCIRFNGSSKGVLSLAVGTDMCIELAANMLGTDPDDPDAEQDARDALMELLNITCGNLLTTLYGVETVFELTPPEAIKIDASDWARLEADPESFAFIIEDYPALFKVHIEEGN